MLKTHILSKTPGLRVLIPVLLLLLLRSLFWFNTFPNPDEAYYWLWGQHPDFSYYDHPPFHAWVQGIVTAIFDKSFFTLRLPNLLSNGILFYTYYRITTYLYGKNGLHYFGLTVALLLASPLYFLFLALAWNDHWLITFCLIAAFQAIQFLESYTADGKGNSKQLYGAAIALGLALLCKYNAIFVGLGLLVAIVANHQWRSLLRDRRLYLAIAMTLLFLLPIVIWNVNNDFQSFRYYTDRSVDAAFRLKWGETLGFIGFSIVMVSPVNSWAIAQVLRRPRTSTYASVAFWIFTVSTVSLIAVSLVSTALYYWNILAYLLLFPLLPPLFFSASPPRDRSVLFTVGQFYGLLFALLLVIQYSVLPLSALGSADSDPDSRMLFGWKQVGAEVQQQAKGLNQPFLVTTDYRSASALAYQLHDSQHPDFTVIAISDRVDQFDFWMDSDRLKGRDAVILADDWHPLQPKLLAQFQRTSPPETITIKRFGVWIKHYYILRGYSFKPN